MRSSPDQSDPGSSPGPCLSKSRKVFAPESCGIISNLTEMFSLHTLSITRSSFHTSFFRSIHRSVFRHRFTKNGFTDPKRLRGFREKCPWSGTLCCVLELGALLSQCRFPPRSINGYWWIVGETEKKLRGSDLPWTSIPSGGSRNTPSRFVLQKPG